MKDGKRELSDSIVHRVLFEALCNILTSTEGNKAIRTRVKALLPQAIEDWVMLINPSKPINTEDLDLIFANDEVTHAFFVGALPTACKATAKAMSELYEALPDHHDAAKIRTSLREYVLTDEEREIILAMGQVNSPSRVSRGFADLIANLGRQAGVDVKVIGMPDDEEEGS